MNNLEIDGKLSEFEGSSEWFDDHIIDGITYWNEDDPLGLIEYLQGIWHWADYFIFDGYNLELHTGGWSGNEELIRALEFSPFWFKYWTRTELGGHYYFKLN